LWWRSHNFGSSCKKQVEDFLEADDYGSAIQLVQEAKKILSSELRGVKCLEEARKYFDKITRDASGKLVDQFLDLAVLKSDVKENQDRMEVLMQAIVNSGDIHELVTPYLQSIKEDIVKTVKAIFVENMNEDKEEENIAQEKENQQVELYISNLEHERFMEIFDKICEKLKEKLQRVRNTEKLVAKCLSSSEESFAENFLKNMSSLVSTACEFCLSRCSKILILREDAHAILDLTRMNELLVKTMTFIKKIEELGKSCCYEIRGTIVHQSKNFSETFHQKRLEKLKELFEEEMWNAEQVPSKYQLLLKHNFAPPQNENDSALAITQNWWQSNWDDEDEEREGDTVDTLILESNGEDTRFRVVKTLIGMLGMMREYAEVAKSLPAIAPEVLSRLVKLVGNFNSRTYKLVLCAGAMQQVGLRSITARHLCVSFSCISLLEVCTPRLITPFFESTSKQRQQKLLKSTLEGNLSDLRDHQREIHKKLVGIMQDLVNSQCDELLRIDWVLHGTRPGPDEPIELRPDRPISMLMKRTKQMHKVLTNYLGDQKRTSIFSEVTSYFATKIFEIFSGIRDDNDTYVRNRLHVNAKFVLDRLNRLDCSTDELKLSLSNFLL